MLADNPKARRMLNAAQVERLKAPGKHPVGGGLYLQVTGTSRSWFFRYRHGDRRRDLGLGSHPLITLSAARQAVLESRLHLNAGRDPIEMRRAERLVARKPVIGTFAEIAAIYIDQHRAGWRNPKSAAQWQASLDAYAMPHLGTLAVDAITTDDVMAVVGPIWTTKTETAARVRGRIEAILDFAKVRGMRGGENPARWRGHLDHLLAAKAKVRPVKHHAALPIAKVPAAMKALAKSITPASLAVSFTALTACRIGEVVGARWDEIDQKSAVWTVPPDRTKTRREHLVPLSRQALAVLKEAAKIRRSDLVFPSIVRGRPISLTGTMMALRRAVPSAEGVTVHGLRSTFRDWCGEQGVPRELAEHALAHVVGSATENAYARSKLLERRRGLMARWSDFACGDEKAKAAKKPKGRR